MHDAFDPPNFPPTTPKKSHPPPHRWEFKRSPKFRKTKPIDLTPGPYANDTEAGLAGVDVSETYRLPSGKWTRRKEPVAYVPPVIIPDPVIPDTTAPVLSGVSVTQTDIIATLAWFTNEGNGTAYWSVDTNATRTSAQVIAAGNSRVVTNIGVQTAFVATGLTASTVYYFHLVHVDVVGNISSVSNTTFTTEVAVIPAVAPSAMVVGDWTATVGNTQITFVIDSPPLNGGGVITDYEYSTNGGSTWASTGRSTPGTYVKTGLVNGVAYNTMMRAKNSAGVGPNSDVKARTPLDPSMSTPTLSVAALAFVARDANGSTWAARTINGATPLSLTVVGTPVLSSTEIWTQNVAVVNCETGCYSGFKTGWPANAALSVLTSADFSRAQLFRISSTSEERFQLLSSATSRVFVANTGAGVVSRWAAGDAALRNEVPIAGAIITQTLAQRHSVKIAFSSAATANITQAGTKIVIGGEISATGVVTSNPDARVLAVVISNNGLPFSVSDASAISTWMAALRAGTLS